MCVSVCLPVCMLEGGRNAVCVGVRCVGVVRRSRCARAAVPARSAAFAAAMHAVCAQLGVHLCQPPAHVPVCVMACL